MTLTRPDNTRSFAAIPGTVARFFGSETAQLHLPDELLQPYQDEYPAVCLLFVDAFGWRFLKHFTETEPIPELVRLCAEGSVTMISSQFPSTTAAHVTTIHTGLPVWESGICEWHYYESRVDRVITPLPFCSPEDSTMNSLQRAGITAEQVFPRGWFYPELTNRSVQTYNFLRECYRHSAYNQAVGWGSHVVHFTNHSDGLQKLYSALSTNHDPTYAFYYFEHFDSVMHRTGPLSPESGEILRSFFEQFESTVLSPLRDRGKKILFLITADHGMTEMDPATTRYLDRELPQAVSWLRTTSAGRPILPAGSARDLFLHIRPECLEEAFDALQRNFQNTARTFLIQDLLSEGYFGLQAPSTTFLDNIGDLLVAPYAGESVYWLGEQGQYRQTFRGHHGGLTADEMESIFLVYPL